MTGQAGVWMLLVFLPCLCTSTVRAEFYHRQGGRRFPPAPYGCCRKSLGQGKALIAGQGQITQILFDNRRTIFEKVNDDIQSIKNDTESVLQNQATAEGLISRCQSQVLNNISVVQDSQDALNENMTKFQDCVKSEIDELQEIQNETLLELRDGRAAIEEGVKSEHEASRELIEQTGNSIHGTLEELKGIVKKVHASIGVLTKKIRSCCYRSKSIRAPYQRH